jgi:hypothetical protein
VEKDNRTSFGEGCLNQTYLNKKNKFPRLEKGDAEETVNGRFIEAV